MKNEFKAHVEECYRTLSEADPHSSGVRDARRGVLRALLGAQKLLAYPTDGGDDPNLLAQAMYQLDSARHLLDGEHPGLRRQLGLVRLELGNYLDYHSPGALQGAREHAQRVTGMVRPRSPAGGNSPATPAEDL